LDSLNIDAPVLAGHSMAGGELTMLGNQHSRHLAGLVYLDALGDPKDFPSGDPAYMELFNRLPVSMRGPSSPPSEREASSFSRVRAWQCGTRGSFPNRNCNTRVTNLDGTMGRFKAPRASCAIAAGGNGETTPTSACLPALFDTLGPRRSGVSAQERGGTRCHRGVQPCYGGVCRQVGEEPQERSARSPSHRPARGRPLRLPHQRG
jgi:pimeloyl-ACP methyl ester carboxylesterase